MDGHSLRDGTRIIDLNSVIEKIIQSEPNVEEIFLFGSRAYKTGSIRSDIDLLVVTKDAINQELWVTIRKFEPYIDLFQLIGTNALSLANQSQISSDSKDNLIKKIDAIKIWNNNDKWIGPSDYRMMEVLSNFHPELTTAELRGFLDPAHHHFDFLIITSVQEELDAIVQRLNLSKKNREISVSPEFVSCEIKTKNSVRKIAISKSHRMGTVAAALNTQRCISAFSPKLVILIGITAGIRNEVNLGDIILPDRIVEYESTKIDEHHESSHGFIPLTDPITGQKISSWPRRIEWQSNVTKRISLPHPRSSEAQNSSFVSKIISSLFSIVSRRPAISEIIPDIKIVNSVAMASGNKVITNMDFISKIQTQFGRKIIAFEMEAIGVAEACETNSKIPFIVIKSVSDFADPGKNDDWHPFCCQVTADLTMTLIEEEVI